MSNRFVKPKYDKRYKKQTLSKAFKKKFNVEGSLAVPINDDLYLFNVELGGEHGFNDEIDLENNALLYYLIKNNNISGDYRIRR